MVSRSPSSSLTRTAQSLVQLAETLSRSGSQLEDRYWELQLGEALDKAFSPRQGRSVEAALDHLLAQRSPAYEVLVDMAETRSESLRLEKDGQAYDALLIAAPMLAWTRYQLPQGRLTRVQHEQTSALLRTAVLAADAKMCALPQLVRFDRLPQTFLETRQWTQTLAQQALAQREEGLELTDSEAPPDLLADVFFFVCAVVVPAGQPIFQWQNARPNAQTPTRSSVAAQWAQGCTRALEACFTGCMVEYLQPDAYYSNTRQADQAIRPLTLKATLTWLEMVAHLSAPEIRVAIVGCGDQNIEEYRIGFSTRKHDDVIFGCIWPSLSREEAVPDLDTEGHADTWDTIAALLHEQGVREVRRLPGLQPMEFCEDCGTPYFPNMLGEMQHPELPEDIDPEPVQLH